ncbi:hypothetical protein [Streptomyces antioxidans]|uniref:hypothetical protein n=1 Tax=Streptomyces antioxidans TaxID=1507734 RepID=UPI00142DAA03|nr:hypothetical protein [Streptomyces antioxidans]
MADAAQLLAGQGGRRQRAGTRHGSPPVVGERIGEDFPEGAQHRTDLVRVLSAFGRGEFQALGDGDGRSGEDLSLIGERRPVEVLLALHVVFAAERPDGAGREQLPVQLLGRLVQGLGELLPAVGEVDAAGLGGGDHFGPALE